MTTPTIEDTFLKNGNVIGLRLTGTILNQVNSLDTALDAKADKTEIARLDAELATKATNDKVSRLESDVQGLGLTVSSKADATEIVRLENMITSGAGAISVADFTLDNPPTREQIDALNALPVGSMYTVNGGTAVLIFRQPFSYS